MLVKLTKILYLFKTEHLDLQGELVNDLQSGYPELISDVRYDSYEWQCLENYPEEAEKAEEENTPGEEEGLPTFEVVDETEQPTPEKKKKKKKKETHDALLPPAVDSKSVCSASISGLSNRRKSASSAVERQKSSIRSHSGREKRDSSLPRGKGSESSTPAIGDGLGGQGGIHQPSFVQIISFSMTNKSCEDKGWIVQAEEAQQEEQRSLLGLLLERLRETLRKVNEDAEVAKLKGHVHPFTNRYYGDAKREAMMKYLQTGRKQVSSRLLNIPTGRLLFPKVPLTVTINSYPSGRIAVMVTNASQGQPGHYTQLYDDDEKRTLLAVFTPTGRGSCYHPNGKISFCTTDKGCMVLDQDGKMTSKSSWPLPHCKLQLPVNIVLNDSLSLRVLNLNQMTVTVSCQKETARIQVGQNMLAEEPQTQEQLGYIATETEFTSNAAKESIRPPPPPPKRKDKKNLKKSQSKYKIITEEEPEVNPLAELLKKLEISEPGSYGIQAERELNKHMRKAKNTLEEWLEHYRLTLGITSPFLQRMPSAPPKRRRPTMSAKSTPGSLPPHRTTEPEDAKGHVDVGGIKGHQRSPSVLAKALQRSLNCKSAPPGVLADEDEDGESIAHLGRVRIEVEGEGRKKYSTSRTISRASRLTRSAVSNMSRKAPSTARTHETEASGDKSRKSSILTGCPVALREEMLGETIISCKCSRHRIPQVTDVELDKFLRDIPRNQLVVLCVVSSLFRNAMPCTDMLLRLYERQNRNRTRLCYQSRFDSYRILLYDVVTAMEGTGNTHPELYLRHNAVPGMFLIYGATKLLFCDHIFNGYGNARKDFQKQLERCKHDAREGNSCLKISDSGLTHLRIHIMEYHSMLLNGEFHLDLVSWYPELSDNLKLSLPFFRGQFQLLSVEGYRQIFKLMNPAVRAMFGEVEALLWLLLVSSASSTEAERSFSALRHLKTWLRSTMTQQRLNHVMVCYIHRERLAQLKPEE
ncbi:hypothetical protein BSL78_28338 [Apostichopus japonicus]|uniref:FAM194 C-terminal domain-containing protein n=1 Tax=Stichopus japonicus TaxID=307972 RepID=A0A2G8JGJ0_STIJA|nr:hypothetical protein BSL78_28338 [Apostichopus japonicus]